MCGIFAYFGPGQPDRDLYNDVVRLAGRRGPHSHGWWSPETGLYHAPGPLREAPQDVYGGIIGHSRLSTLGDFGIEGAQPVMTKGSDVLVHNGNAYNWMDLDATAPTDSYALGTVYSQNRDAGMDPTGALQDVVDRADQQAFALVILDRHGSLIGARRKLPLYVLQHLTGVYAASGRIVGSSEIPEGTAVTLAE